jgi:thioredoxin reductase (NADPH)
MADNKIERIIIIGSGPAGHTAAIYAARADLAPVLFEGFMAGGVAAGGQLTTTTEVENFPGFPDPVVGPELMEKMRQQSERYGTRILTETVSAVDLQRKPFRVYADSGEFSADVIIIATGAIAKRMNLPGEDRLWQKGISACAVCDGALPIFRDNPLVVIGGGDSAAEEATYLSKFGSTIHLIIRRDVMRASKAMQKRVLDNPKIKIHWKTLPIEVIGENVVSGVRVRDKETETESIIEAAGLFYAIGHKPNTEFIEGQLETDEQGYIITKPNSTATNVEGVFACGDVQDKIFRQAVTSAGTGCMAALEAEHYLAAIE